MDPLTPTPTPPAAPAELPPVPNPSALTTPDTPSSQALSEAFAKLSGDIASAMQPPAPAAATPPRDESGRFTRVDGDEPPAAPPPAAPPADTPSEPAAPPAPAPAAPSAPAAAEATPPAEPAPVGDDAEPDPALVVELLPRHEHQEPVRIVVDSPEMAEVIRMNLNGAMRREEFEAQIQQVEAERQRVENEYTALIVDPIDTVQRTLTPDQQETLVLSLLTRDDLFQRVSEKLALLNDDLGRRELRLEVREKQSVQREEAERRVTTQRAVQRNLREIQSAVAAIVPEHLSPAQRELWRKDALNELAAVARRAQIVTLDPLQIPTVLNARLVASGVDPTDALATIDRTLNGRTRPSRATSPAAVPASTPRSAPAALASPATPPAGTRTVQTVRAAHERRVAASAPAASGVGAPTATPVALPANAGLDEAFALLRQQVASGAAAG